MNDLVSVQAKLTIDGVDHRALALRLVTALDDVGRLECELTDDAGGPFPEALVGRRLTLTLEREDGSSKASFAGLVIEAAHVGDDGALARARLVASSRLWRASMRTDRRVFLERTTQAIVTEVLEKAGLPSCCQRWQLREDRATRPHTVQHGETDLEFVRRLCAEEGIAFVVEAWDGEDHVVFFEGDLGPVDGAEKLPFAHEHGFASSRDVVTRLEQRVALRTDRITLRDLDFERPDVELRGEARAGAGNLEAYDYPARTNDEATAKRYAEVRLASLRATSVRLSGESHALHLAPGRTFTTSGHPLAALDGAQLVLRTEHRFHAEAWGTLAEARHGCRFESLPVAVGPYRPTLLPVARRVAGYTSAVVAAPAGEELHVDAHGAVRAQPLWDREGKRDEAAAPFARVAQVALGGGLLSPRAGWEVTVQYLEGDPDRPIVTGRMVTAKAPPPYPLPEHKTRSVLRTATSPGGGDHNEIMFDDKKGAEEMFLGASRNMAQSAGNNATETVGGNELRKIGSDQTIDVSGSMSAVAGSQKWSITSNQTIGVSTYLVDESGGAHTLSVGGARNLTIGGDHRRLVSGSSALEVGGRQLDVVVGSVTDATLSTLDESVGAALIEIAVGGHNVVCSSRAEDVAGAKAVLASGGRGVTIGGGLSHDVAGALLVRTSGAVGENAGGDLSNVAGGAQIVKATNVTFSAKSLLTVVCGGSTLTLTPGSVTLAGASIKLDGTSPDTAPLVKDN
ncbi:MAG: type VI secretion system tip protein VgrG [Deltaproteobacteria bacterium]|nr:type VI secretion system tip protein VgrG [Deltaproteobacteria bacterium]